jgi:hypothetical protein
LLVSYSNVLTDKAIFEYIEGGSSNGGMPLFACYKRIPVGNNFTFFNKPTAYINVGVQVQGDNFKYYVSAENALYNETTVIDPSYKDFATKTLLALDENAGFKLNANKTKTFFSRSYKISDFIESDEKITKPRDIFAIANEIATKVNVFVSNDTARIVQEVLEGK